jgi:hypothetical protein
MQYAFATTNLRRSRRARTLPPNLLGLNRRAQLSPHCCYIQLHGNAFGRPCAPSGGHAHLREAMHTLGRPCTPSGGHAHLREAMRTFGRPCTPSGAPLASDATCSTTPAGRSAEGGGGGRLGFPTPCSGGQEPGALSHLEVPAVCRWPGQPASARALAVFRTKDLHQKRKKKKTRVV